MTKFIFEQSEFTYQDKDILGNPVKIIRQNGIDLIIHAKYQGVYGLGEKFNAVNQIGKKVTNEVVEKFCNQGEFSYCVTPFFVTNTGIGIYIRTKEKIVFNFKEIITVCIPSDAEVIIFTGSIKDVIAEYMKLFGRAKIPPDYAFGIWISANHWNQQKDVENHFFNYAMAFRTRWRSV